MGWGQADRGQRLRGDPLRLAAGRESGRSGSSTTASGWILRIWSRIDHDTHDFILCNPQSPHRERLVPRRPDDPRRDLQPPARHGARGRDPLRLRHEGACIHPFASLTTGCIPDPTGPGADPGTASSIQPCENASRVTGDAPAPSVRRAGFAAEHPARTAPPHGGPARRRQRAQRAPSTHPGCPSPSTLVLQLFEHRAWAQTRESSLTSINAKLLGTTAPPASRANHAAGGTAWLSHGSNAARPATRTIAGTRGRWGTESSPSWAGSTVRTPGVGFASTSDAVLQRRFGYSCASFIRPRHHDRGTRRIMGRMGSDSQRSPLPSRRCGVHRGMVSSGIRISS